MIFPHHENEIAQSESFTGKKPFVKYWLHNGLLQFGEDKMSKSLGNLVTIKQALTKYSPDAIRIFILNSHYRSPLTYSEEGLEAAEKGVERFTQAISRQDPTGGKGKALDAQPYRQRFIEAMDDDFNTAQALATMFDLAREINEAGDSGLSFSKAQSTLVSLAREVLGLKLAFKNVIIEVPKLRLTITTYAPTVILGTVSARVNRLIEERVKCRKEKNWQQADEIRKKLAALGVILEDKKDGIRAAYKSVPSEESLDSLLKELGIDFKDSLKKAANN
ncbi:Cysteine--tRNA ligase [subsurface metagenome]